MAINGSALHTETVSSGLIYQWTDATTGETHTVPMGVLTETLFQQAIAGEDFSTLWARRLGSISSGFLNGTAKVFAPRIDVISEMVLEYRDSEGRSFIHGEAADEILTTTISLAQSRQAAGSIGAMARGLITSKPPVSTQVGYPAHGSSTAAASRRMAASLRT